MIDVIVDPATYSFKSVLLVRLTRLGHHHLDKLEDHLGSANLSVLYRQPLFLRHRVIIRRRKITEEGRGKNEERSWKKEEGRRKKKDKPTSSSLSPGRIESIPDLTEVGFGLIPYSEINLGMIGTKSLYHFSVSGLAGTVWPLRNSNDWQSQYEYAVKLSSRLVKILKDQRLDSRIHRRSRARYCLP